MLTLVYHDATFALRLDKMCVKRLFGKNQSLLQATLRRKEALETISE